MQLFYYLVLNIQRLTAFPIRKAYQNFTIQLKKKKKKQGSKECFSLFVTCPCNLLSLISLILILLSNDGINQAEILSRQKDW